MTATTPTLPVTPASTTTSPPRQLPGRPWHWLALVAAVQTAVLAWMVADRISLLRTGREITLTVVPVDPRSLFRGDYVNLGYDISRVEIARPPDTVPLRRRGQVPVWVQLEPGADGAWKVAAASLERPKDVAKERVLLAGRTQFDWVVAGDFAAPSTPGAAGAPARTRKVFVRYGIEKYFLPEGTGIPIEQAVRDRKITATLAVSPAGVAAIKALSIDGKRVHVEPVL